MKPVMKFGQSNEYGFDVTPQCQLIIMKLEDGKYGPVGVDEEIHEEIRRNGGLDALIEQLFKMKGIEDTSTEPEPKPKKVDAAAVKKAEAEKELKAEKKKK